MWVRAAAAESRRSRRRNDDALASLQPSGRGTEFAGPRGDSPTIQMNTAVPQARGPGGACRGLLEPFRNGGNLCWPAQTGCRIESEVEWAANPTPEGAPQARGRRDLGPRPGVPGRTHGERTRPSVRRASTDCIWRPGFRRSAEKEETALPRAGLTRRDPASKRMDLRRDGHRVGL